MAKHREADQSGDRIKILKAGQKALIKMARQSGIPDLEILKAIRSTDHR